MSIEIEAFRLHRQRYGTINEHVKILHKFIDSTGIQAYEDITEGDIAAYIKSLQFTVSTEYRRSQIVQALFLFVQFRKLQEIRALNHRKRGRPEKLERNKEFISLRRQKLTYDEIASKYKLNKRTVYDIIKRLENNN